MNNHQNRRQAILLLSQKPARETVVVVWEISWTTVNPTEGREGRKNKNLKGKHEKRKKISEIKHWFLKNK
jgi:hypothetical protein